MALTVKLMERVEKGLAMHSEQQPLTIHIGYPKTATTFLQHKVFRREGLNLIHRKWQAHLTSALAQFLRMKTPKPLNEALLSELSEPATIVSNENYTVPVNFMWFDREAHAIEPDVLAERLFLLQEQLGRPVQVLLTLRRQDGWLALRYAESAKKMESPSQSDFELKVINILDHDAIKRSWIHYDKLVESLFARLGRSQVLVLLLEDMKDEPERWRQSLIDFVDFKFPKKLFAGDRKKNNALKSGEKTWALKKHEGHTIQLDEALKLKILDNCRDSNMRLAKLLERDLSKHGYY